MTAGRWSPAAFRLTALFLGYLGMLVAAMTAGGTLALWQGQALVVPEHGPRSPDGTAFLIRVFESNARVWFYTCIGLVSFGAAGLVVLCGNAFRFGMDVVSMAHGAPRELVYLVPHASLEFLAFILAGASCQYLAWWLFDLLVLDRPRVPIRAGVQALACSFDLLMVAACVEALSRGMRFGS